MAFKQEYECVPYFRFEKDMIEFRASNDTGIHISSFTTVSEDQFKGK